MVMSGGDVRIMIEGDDNPIRRLKKDFEVAYRSVLDYFDTVADKFDEVVKDSSVKDYFKDVDWDVRKYFTKKKD